MEKSRARSLISSHASGIKYLEMRQGFFAGWVGSCATITMPVFPGIVLIARYALLSLAVVWAHLT